MAREEHGSLWKDCHGVDLEPTLITLRKEYEKVKTELLGRKYGWKIPIIRKPTDGI